MLQLKGGKRCMRTGSWKLQSVAGDRPVMCWKATATVLMIRFEEVFIPELQCSHFFV